MDFVKQCFEEEPTIFTERLQAVGFSVEQARKFITDASPVIIESTQKTGAFRTITFLLSGRQRQVPKIIDVEVIAKSSAINVEQVIKGLHDIALTLLQVYSKESKSFVKAASSFSVLKQAS